VTTVAVYEDPAVIELVDAATHALVAHVFGRQVDWGRLRDALADVPVPEEEE